MPTVTAENKTKTLEEYKSINIRFTDYTRFEDEIDVRQAAREAFINGSENTPLYNYPRLFFLRDANENEDEEIASKKRKLYEAVLELEAARLANPDSPEAANIELYQNYYDLRLKKIMLVEEARHLHYATKSSEVETARESYMELNEAVYGEFNKEWYLAMLSTEARKLQDFQPLDDNAAQIKDELMDMFSKIDTKGEHEPELLSAEKLEQLHGFLEKRYGHIFEQIPNTPDDVYYNAQETAEIINKTLKAGGLAELGWECIINSKKTVVSTTSMKKIISLPANLRRNATEIKRLVAHEQEVHARRGQNAFNAGFDILKRGTADYADIEEGLGVIFECGIAKNANNPSFDRARDRYIVAGLALGIDSNPRDARETYEITWRLLALRLGNGIVDEEVMNKAKHQAYDHVENAFRGTDFWMKGVIYSKLKIYYEGFRKNAAWVSEHIEKGDLEMAIDKAMIGKYNHVDSVESKLVFEMFSLAHQSCCIDF